MDTTALSLPERFKNEVGIKFQLFNSLFTSLPFHRIEKTGILLTMLLHSCEEEYERGKSPVQIISEFFEKHTNYSNEEEQLDLLFRFVQYAERQVVLFDALEDAAFSDLNDTNGAGSLKSLLSRVTEEEREKVFGELLHHFGIRLVLTAHPTQFYPGEVLGIINDLSKALSDDNNGQVNMYLQQLGKTPFLKKTRPTPYDEALTLIWFLENVFYQAASKIIFYLKRHFPFTSNNNNPFIRLGFWPGGDRDGNPFVTADITCKVARQLRSSILKCYYLDVRKLKRRLTFKGVVQPIAKLEKSLYEAVFLEKESVSLTTESILKTLHDVRHTLKNDHGSLFIHMVESLINKVELFGLYFASLDIRQDSGVHTNAIQQIVAGGISNLPAHYNQMSNEEKINCLAQPIEPIEVSLLTDATTQDVLESMRAMKSIQTSNGEAGSHRYIISHCENAVQVMEVFAMLQMSGWPANALQVDIVPLFETIDDLKAAKPIMEALYANPIYRQHLSQRHNRQTIMVGFSDGTKDGGYLMANWGIYKAKEELTTVSRSYDVEVVFFDGRGGPPSRGGGKTHKFYASMGQNISNREIQLTIQGQTVSSNFGTIDAAQYNMEQLIHAGISNVLFSSKLATLEPSEDAVMEDLSVIGHQAYMKLRNHPNFVDYLSNASPLKYYSDTNIASRPARRGNTAKLSLTDLRAIPFVGAWSQIKQNVTGYYGVGTSLKFMEEQGRWNEVESLYHNSLFFKTLLDNCEMAMKKCFFPLTAYLGNHAVYGPVWHMIYNEYELTCQMILKLSGKKELMGDYPVEKMSIEMRERIVLPLTTIQQFGLARLRKMEEQVMASPLKDKYESLVMRCSFGIINAGRNSA